MSGGIKRIYLPSKGQVEDDAALLAFQEIERQSWNDVGLNWDFGFPIAGANADIGIRQSLTQGLDFYVSSTGLDALTLNNGLSTASPFATPQFALTAIGNYVDLAGFSATIHVGNGSYAGWTTPVFVGNGTVTVAGAGSSNVTITSGVNVGALGTRPTALSLKGLKLASTLVVNDRSQLTLNGTAAEAMHFAGSGPINQIFLTRAASLRVERPYTMSTPSGGTNGHMAMRQSAAVAWISGGTQTFTFSGTPTFSAFIAMDSNATMNFVGSTFTFSGSFIGQPFFLINGGRLLSNGSITTTALAGAYFPGTLSANCDTWSSFN